MCPPSKLPDGSSSAAKIQLIEAIRREPQSIRAARIRPRAGQSQLAHELLWRCLACDDVAHSAEDQACHLTSALSSSRTCFECAGLDPVSCSPSETPILAMPGATGTSACQPASPDVYVADRVRRTVMCRLGRVFAMISIS